MWFRRAVAIGLATGGALGVGVLLTLLWPALRIIWPVVFLAVLPTGALAACWALRPRAGVRLAMIAGLVAGTGAGIVSAGVLLAASVREPAWSLVGVLSAPPFALGPYTWFDPVPWPLPLLVPLGAALAAAEAGLYYRFVADPTADVRSLLADWIARRPMGLHAKLLVGCLLLAAGSGVVGLEGFAMLEDMHQRLHGLELQAEWLTHLHAVQAAVVGEQAVLVDLATTPRPETLDRLPALDARVRAELDHLADYPPHPALVLNEAQRRMETAALRPRVEAVRIAHARFSEELQAASADYLAVDPTQAAAEAARLVPLGRELDGDLELLAGELGDSVFDRALEIDAAHHAALQELLGLAVLWTVLAALLAAALARAIVRPVRAMAAQLRTMGQGNFSRRLTVANADELGWLAGEVNRVNGQLASLYDQLQGYATNLEHRVAVQVAEIEQAQRLQRYLPRQLVERVLRGEIVVSGQHERRKVTILFADMQGFTDLSDRIEAEELGELVNEYFAVMADAVFRHGGTLPDFIGDAVMVVFGAPEAPRPGEDARRAIALALDIQRAVAVWAQSWRQRGLDRAPAVRIGVHSGYATVGTFGTSDRTEYAAIGRTTNIAARVQTAAQPGALLVTWATRALAGEEFTYLSRGQMQAKGVHAPIELFEVLAPEQPGVISCHAPDAVGHLR